MKKSDSVSFRLLTRADTAAVVAVMQDDAGFSHRVHGRDFVPADLDGFFDAVPPGIELGQKYSVGIFVDGQLVGLADLLDGYPQPGTAYIGLLQIKASEHGKGYARLLHEELQRLLPGRQRWCLSVVDTNEQALPFWQALGYEPTGETKNWQDADGAVHRVFLLDNQGKILKADSQGTSKVSKV